MTSQLSMNIVNSENISVEAGYSIFNLKIITKRLLDIFEQEIKRPNSIIISINKNAITKMAMFISGAIERSASIGIAGETASGKSTITLEMITSIERFAKEFCIDNAITRINSDDYYYDRSDMVKKAGSFANFANNYDLDVPDAIELSLMNEHILQLLNGNSVMLPKYDMSGTAKRFDNQILVNPSKVIISEGLFNLNEKVKNAFDFKIYVDISKEVQEKRFFLRANERNLGASAQNILDNASQKAQIYIKPCKETADIVLSGEADIEKYKEFLNKILNLIEEIHLTNIPCLC